MEEYKKYYEDIEELYEKLIITDETSGKIDSYQNGLKDALDANNAENGKYNFDKLQEIEKEAISYSENKISDLQASLKKWEKKSTSASVKKESEYKKNKSLAEELERKDYKKAKTYYEACIDALKQAKENASDSSNDASNNASTNAGSSGSTSSSNDSWYTYTGQDSIVYNEVYFNYLNPSEVATM